MRDAYSLGMEADHIINVWGFDGNLPRLAGKAAEGAMGAAGIRAPHRGRSKYRHSNGSIHSFYYWVPPLYPVIFRIDHPHGHVFP